MSWVPAGGWPWQQEVVGVARSRAWAGGGRRELLLRGQTCLSGLQRAGWDWPRGVAGGLAWGLARGVALHRAAVSGPGMLLRRQENPAVLPCPSARCGATGDRRAPGAKSCLRVSHPGFFINFRGIQASHKLPPGHPQTDVHASPPVTPSGCCRPWQPVPAPSLPLPS